MKSWILAVLVVAVVAAVALAFFIKKKEKYTAQTMFLGQPGLRPVLRGENSETMDVLAYSLGGLSKQTHRSC
jgi:uncharacterized protein involved in exopolysaccharide biosynthesis